MVLSTTFEVSVHLMTSGGSMPCPNVPIKFSMSAMFTLLNVIRALKAAPVSR